jgi:flagellar motor protein MotB
MAKIKTGPKLILIATAVASLIGGVRYAGNHGWISTPGIMKTIIPSKTGDIPKVEDAQVKNVTPIAAPSKSKANVPATLIRGEVWEWNAQNGMFFANGGADTTQGSLMEKHKVNLNLSRQDDTTKMGADLIHCAKELKDGATQCSSGANFVVIMGDGAGNFASGVNPQLKSLGEGYALKAIAAVGYSRGEDACMLPPEAKKDPNAAKGILIEAVLRDGDWNICQKWLGDNNIPTNPDEKTYNPNAVNWVNASDYNVAAADYVAGKCEDRPVVINDHPTGDKKHICVGGVATWTPGDVVAAEKKGGLVKVASSKEYSSQMPATIIGPGKFFRDNREEVENMLAAIFEGSDQVKAFDAHAKDAADIAAGIYQDTDPAAAKGAYWYKYYKGVVETDAQGLRVSLGGSTVSNLADNQILFGLNPGSNDNFRSTYTVFADLATQQYPNIYKSTPIPDVKDVEDTSFIKGVTSDLTGITGGDAETTDYSSNESAPVVSAKDYSIQFDTGKATFTPVGLAAMKQIKDSFAITGLFISVDGYTDNTGNEQANVALSQARAEAVKSYLQHAAPKNFPNSRFAVAGHGSQDPIGDNSTAAGRAANRRVHITLSGN